MPVRPGTEEPFDRCDREEDMSQAYDAFVPEIAGGDSMIPALLAKEWKDAVLEYIDTVFPIRDDRVRGAWMEFLQDPEMGLFKGIYPAGPPPLPDGGKSGGQPPEAGAAALPALCPPDESF